MSKRNTIVGSFQFHMLNQYPGARVAFSMRKLRAEYGGACLRVRRSSDNTEQDIGFNSSGWLDTAAMLSFVGAGSGFVVTWYDQSGSGGNASQASTSNQPRIVNTGTLETDGGLPCINFGSRADAWWLDFSGTGLDAVRNVSYAQGYLVLHPQSTASGSKPALVLSSGSSANQVRWSLINALTTANRMDIAARRLDAVGAGVITSDTDHNAARIQTSALVNYNDADAFLYQNGTQVASNTSFLTSGVTTNTASLNGHIGRQTGGSPVYWDGQQQEVVLYVTDQTANRAGIERHQMQAFGI